MYLELDTPSLVIDLDAVRGNIAEMAETAATHGVRLRPHIKTHKMPELARMQLDAGASGITCAKLGEAEVMADAGIDDILLAFPIWGEPKLRRLAALRERARVRVSLDSVEVAAGLGKLGGPPVEVLVEVDTGQHRLGRPPGRPTADLVAEIAAVPGWRSWACSRWPGTPIIRAPRPSWRRPPAARARTSWPRPSCACATASSCGRSASAPPRPPGTRPGSRA
ncbi:alanine racemase [Nonomuraea antimicrobica]